MSVGCCHNLNMTDRNCGDDTVGYQVFIGGPSDITPNVGKAVGGSSAEYANTYGGFSGFLSDDGTKLTTSSASGCGCDAIESHTVEIYECKLAVVDTDCVPDCDGATCGDNGCGGTCGICSANETCVGGACSACPEGQVPACNDQCSSELFSLGDGFCDSVFNCAEANWDNGDCSAQCVDTDNGATDSDGDGCWYYTFDPAACGGSWDDDDFWSGLMCCACGGGSTG